MASWRFLSKPARTCRLALLIVLSTTPATAETISAILDPLTVDTAAGPVRLAGLHVPAAQAEPAKALLAELALGRDVEIDPANPPRDRHGRRLAQIGRDDGLWLEGELLRRGLAVVRTLPESRTRATEMLAIEARARKERQGIWREPPIWQAENVRGDGFRIVEGTVIDAARRRGTLYLNFGADWRTDFTVAIDSADVSGFVTAGLDPQTLAGVRLRVRGWVRDYNGPYLEADHPEQIEILEAREPRLRPKSGKRAGGAPALPGKGFNAGSDASR